MADHTLPLPDGRSIETSAEVRAGRLRLRARLIGADGLVHETLRRDYDAADPRAVAEFAAEWDRLTGISIDRPLFDLAGRRAGREPLPKEFSRDPAVAAATYDPGEEIAAARWRLAAVRPAI
jgi:hypothetical protein